MRRQLRCGAFFAALTIMTALCATDSAQSQETLKFGVCLPVTGAYWELGGSALAGVEIRVAEIMSDPSAPRLEVVVKDNQSDPQLAVSQLKELAADPDIVFVIGPTSSDVCRELLPYATKLRIPMISPTVTLPGIGTGDCWIFPVLFSDSVQAVILARYALNRNLMRAAVIFDPGVAYSDSILTNFRKAYTALGGKIVAEETFSAPVDRADLFDYTQPLTMIMRAEPNLVLLPNYPEAVSAIIRQSQVVGFRPIFVGGDSWAHENVILASGHNLNGAFFVNPIDCDKPSAELKDFFSQLDNSNEQLAGYSSVMGYDAVSLGLKASEGAKNRDEFRENLFRILDYPLATGKITIDRKHGILKTANICEIIKEDGEFVLHTRASFAPEDVLRELESMGHN